MHTKNHPRGAQTLFVALALFVSIAPAISARTAFTEIVAFGDSLSDPGNAAGLTGGLFPPQAMYPTGTFSNGPVWVDYLAEALGMEGQVTNLAFGGAFTGSGNLRVPGLPGITEELGMYDEMTGGVADPDALYLIQGGANDLFFWLEGGMPTPPEIPITMGVTNLVAAVNRLAEMGARHFVVSNLPDVGRTPFGVGSGGSAMLSAYCAGFNAALEANIAALADARGLNVTLLDEFGFINDAVDHPADYGFTNVSVPYLFVLAGNPDDFLFWDSVHPTTAGHEVTAQVAVATLLSTYWPGSSHASQTGRLNGLNGLVKAK